MLRNQKDLSDVTLRRLQLLRGPCTFRSADKHGEREFFHGSSGTQSAEGYSRNHERGEWMSCALSGAVLDLAWFSYFLNFLINLVNCLALICRADFSPEGTQFAPTVIAWRNLATTISLVPVSATSRADSFARLTADKLHGQSQQNRFPQHVF
jgi:hypothetical protein